MSVRYHLLEAVDGALDFGAIGNIVLNSVHERCNGDAAGVCGRIFATTTGKQASKQKYGILTLSASVPKPFWSSTRLLNLHDQTPLCHARVCSVCMPRSENLSDVLRAECLGSAPLLLQSIH